MARKPAAESEQPSNYNMDGAGSDADPNALPSIIEADVDLDGEVPPPDPLPKGVYPVTVNTCTVKMSQKGNRYVEVVMFLSPEHYPVDFNEGNPAGTNLTYRRIDANINPTTQKLTPRAAYSMSQFMKTLGMRGGKSIDVNEWAGKELRVRVDHRPSQNDPNLMLPEIVAVLPA